MIAQLGLFDAPPPVVSPVERAAPDPVLSMWSSPDPLERRLYYLHAAQWWREWATSGCSTSPVEAHEYAANQELLAGDIERRPEMYLAKPGNVTDWQWYRQHVEA